MKVVDRCVGCKCTDLDFSPAAFSVLEDMTIGRLQQVEWEFVQNSPENIGSLGRAQRRRVVQGSDVLKKWIAGFQPERKSTKPAEDSASNFIGECPSGKMGQQNENIDLCDPQRTIRGTPKAGNRRNNRIAVATQAYDPAIDADLLRRPVLGNGVKINWTSNKVPA